MIHFNRSFALDVRCAGFCMYNPGGWCLVKLKRDGRRYTNNKAECLAVVNALDFFIWHQFDHLGDYVLVKVDS